MPFVPVKQSDSESHIPLTTVRPDIETHESPTTPTTNLTIDVGGIDSNSRNSSNLSAKLLRSLAHKKAAGSIKSVSIDPDLMVSQQSSFEARHRRKTLKEDGENPR